MKTVRFTQVVEKSGKPEIHFRFGPLEKDPELQRALKQKRVMTVHHEPRGQKKDYGTVGLENDRHAQILIFPKSVASFANKHVIAINYDLVPDEKTSTGPRPAKEPAVAKPARASRRTSPASKKPTTEPEKPEPPPPKESEAPKLRVLEDEPEATSDANKLLREIRAALRELKSGKTVAAYQRLDQLVTPR